MVFSDTLVKAVSWTLLHSLWQGIVLAFCAGLIIVMTKKSAAAVRYNLLSGLFVGFLFVVGLMFNYEFNSDNTATSFLNLPIVNSLNNGEVSTISVNDFTEKTVAFLNDNANFIALFWLLIFAFKLLGIANAFAEVYRIRNYRTFSPSDYWKSRVSELAAQIHIQKSIVLLESALIKIPSVTGFFKPMILVPVGMLTTLPHDQIEAILLHELAHIQRKDYAMNLLQYLGEMLFFFNPGLLWLSSLIRDERENCCDDIALGITGNKTEFIHALISFERYNNEKLAVAFAGRKSHLLQRAKRIIYDDNKSLDAIEKTFLSLSFVMVAIVVFVCMNPKELKPEVSSSNPKTFLKTTTTTETISTVETTTSKSTDSKQNANGPYTIKKETEQVAETCTPTPTCGPAPEESLMQTPGTISLTNGVTTRIVNSKTSTEQSFEKETTFYDTSNANGSKKVVSRTGISGKNLSENTNIDDLTKGIISDLINENIIKTTQGLSYKLSDSSLIVNGVKQCETVHSRLKTKYVKSKIFAICYNYEYSVDI